MMYRITKNFHDKKLSRNATQEYFAEKNFAKGGLACTTDYSSAKFCEKNFHDTLKSTKFAKVFSYTVSSPTIMCHLWTVLLVFSLSPSL